MKHEFGPLKALDETGEVEIKKEPNLVNYLHRLDGLNFIQPNPGHGLNEIEQIPNGQKFKLKYYLHITDDGKVYLDVTTKLKIFKSGVAWTDAHPWTPLPPSR
jgi:predicted transcriptional regulator